MVILWVYQELMDIGENVKRITKKIFKILKYQKKGKGGEVHITDSIKTLINQGNLFIGHNFKGKYLDCGTLKGYINSGLEISKL